MNSDLLYVIYMLEKRGVTRTFIQVQIFIFTRTYNWKWTCSSKDHIIIQGWVFFAMTFVNSLANHNWWSS